MGMENILNTVVGRLAKNLKRQSRRKVAPIGAFVLQNPEKTVRKGRPSMKRKKAAVEFDSAQLQAKKRRKRTLN